MCGHLSKRLSGRRTCQRRRTGKWGYKRVGSLAEPLKSEIIAWAKNHRAKILEELSTKDPPWTTAMQGGTLVDSCPAVMAGLIGDITMFESGKVSHMIFFHDDNCPKLNGGQCTCDPDMELRTEFPWELYPPQKKRMGRRPKPHDEAGDEEILR